MGRMRFGARIPASGPVCSSERVIESTREAENLGYDSVWIMDHVHNSFDYTIGNTRVITNPMGYPCGPKRSLENELFNPELLVEI